jgi:hypothetical protein
MKFLNFVLSQYVDQGGWDSGLRVYWSLTQRGKVASQLVRENSGSEGAGWTGCHRSCEPDAGNSSRSLKAPRHASRRASAPSGWKLLGERNVPTPMPSGSAPSGGTPSQVIPGEEGRDVKGQSSLQITITTFPE